MKAIMTTGLLLLWLVLPLPAQPVSGYRTLVIEYIGPTNRPSFPIIISTSSKEGEWYRHHLFPDPIDIFARVNIVKASTLKDITDLQLLKGSLDRRVSAEVSISRPTLKFVAGAGDDHTEATVDAQTGLKILLALDRYIAEYPKLRSDLSEVERRVRYQIRR
jgi:hypothetical protein